MLWLVVAFLLAAMFVARRTKGPIWAMAIAWLISIVPVAAGTVTYNFFDANSAAYALDLIAFIGTYFAGACLWRLLPRVDVLPSAAAARDSFATGFTTTKVIWWLAVAGTAGVLIDFYVSGGAGLDDLAALRDQIVERKSATLLAQISSVLTWACLYCYIFALSFRRRLAVDSFLVMLVPIAGYFMLSVVSAGRQAAFQIMTVALLVALQNRARQSTAVGTARQARSRRRFSWTNLIAGLTLVAAMSGYMGYVAVARNDSRATDDKGALILRLFDAEINPSVDQFISRAGPDFHSAVVEAVIYFTSPVALFDNFEHVAIPRTTYGALSLPFLFRQVQGLTGIPAIAVLTDKIERLNASGVIGAGWTNGISSFLEDFGVAGALAVLFGLGFYSEAAWDRACRCPDLNAVVIGIVVLLIAVYMPLTFALADTNIFLLWLVTIALRAVSPRQITRSAGMRVQAS